jgi:methionyl-tRNA formyltransferase
MRNILVLSEITYVPNNCNTFLDEVLRKHSSSIHTVVILQNLNFNIFVKIIWLYCVGCPKIATELLRNVSSVVVKSRERLLMDFNIPYLKVKNINETDIVNYIKTNKIDCIFNIRTRCIYKKDVLSTPVHGCFNIHHGILPKYRGMYCDLYALYENRPAGISLHKMNKKIDDGNIIYTKTVSTHKDKDYISYLKKTGSYEANLIDSFIKYFNKHYKVPKGVTNRRADIVYTRTPSISMIRKMKLSGMDL